MEFNGCYFYYRGMPSHEFPLIFANVRTSESDVIIGDYSTQTIFNKKNRKNYLAGYDYSNSALKIEADIVTLDGSPIDDSIIAGIERWLFQGEEYDKLYSISTSDYEYHMTNGVIMLPKKPLFGSYGVYNVEIKNSGGSYVSLEVSDTPATGCVTYSQSAEICKLTPYEGDGWASNAEFRVSFLYDNNQVFISNSGVYHIESYINCVLTNPTKIYGNGGVIGFSCIIECDGCSGYSDNLTKEFNVTSTPSVITLDTSLMFSQDDYFGMVPLDGEYIYPKITATIGNTGGTVTLINNTDDTSRLTTFADLTANSTLIIDSEHNYVNSTNYTKFTNKNFPRLIYGENKIAVIGNVTKVKFEWVNRRLL